MERGRPVLLRRDPQAGGRRREHLRVRSVVGLVPLFATLAIEPDVLERLPRFRRRDRLVSQVPARRWPSNACLLTEPGAGGYRLMAIVDRAKLEAVLAAVLDPAQFLSDYGLRSLSKEHAAAPYDVPRPDGGL